MDIKGLLIVVISFCIGLIVFPILPRIVGIVILASVLTAGIGAWGFILLATWIGNSFE
jgi:ABC-type multidrug transport system permease subunit